MYVYSSVRYIQKKREGGRRGREREGGKERERERGGRGIERERGGDGERGRERERGVGELRRSVSITMCVHMENAASHHSTFSTLKSIWQMGLVYQYRW